LGEKTFFDKAGVPKRYLYDVQGNLTGVTENNIGQILNTKYFYDLQNNLVKIVNSAGEERNMNYDFLGRKTFDTLNNLKFAYDLSGKFRTTVYGTSTETLSEQFDLLGRKVAESGNVVGNTWVYDHCGITSVGKVCIASSTDGVVQNYSYDSSGNLAKEEIKINSSKNNRKIWNPTAVTYFKTDLSGNILEEGTGVATVTKNYFKNYLREIFYEDVNLGRQKVLGEVVYNNLDQVQSYRRGELETENIFDENKLNRLTNINSTFATNTLQRLDYHYDNLSRINNINDKYYEYDTLGQLTKSSSSKFIEQFIYDNDYNLKTKNSENIGKYYGRSGNLQFDPMGRIVQKDTQNFVWDMLSNLKEVNTSIGTASTSVKYFYDVNGIRKMTLSFAGSTTNKIFTPTNNYLLTDQGDSRVVYFNDKPIISIESGSGPVTKVSTTSKDIILNISTSTTNFSLQNLKINEKQNVVVNWGVATGLLQPKIVVTSGKASLVPTINKNRLATTTKFIFTPFTEKVSLSVTLGGRSPQNYLLDLKIASTTRVEVVLTTTESYKRVYNLLADHLNTVEKVIDFKTGKEVSKNEFESFGGLAVGTTSKDHLVIQNKKFTGHEDEQDKTGLIYMKGRYYDPKLGIFISIDPATQNILAGSELLANPISLNPYVYAWNNPVNAFDPNGKLTIVVPGTWHKDTVWNQNNQLYLNAAKTFNETPVLFNDRTLWNGGNNHNDRMLAGNNLADFINNYQFAEGEKLNIVAHSHGGNVVKIASHMLNEDISIDNFVTLGTPVRPDYPTNMSVVKNMVEVYSNNDFVQVNGGNKYQLRALPGYVANGARTPFSFNNYSYERGPAGRFENQSNAVDVTAFTTGNNIFKNNAHTQLWSVQSIWENVIGR
jgi:RHS repeat-associated protein